MGIKEGRYVAGENNMKGRTWRGWYEESDQISHLFSRLLNNDVFRVLNSPPDIPASLFFFPPRYTSSRFEAWLLSVVSSSAIPRSISPALNLFQMFCFGCDQQRRKMSDYDVSIKRLIRVVQEKEQVKIATDGRTVPGTTWFWSHARKPQTNHNVSWDHFWWNIVRQWREWQGLLRSTTPMPP